MDRLHFSGLSALVFGLVLSGCGGGSSGDNNQASSANSSSVSSVVASSSISSALSSSSASSSSLPTVTQLTIQGRVAVDALAEGEVVFTIGTTDYVADITNTLSYSVQLEVPEQDADKPFVAVATGSGADSWVQLAASFPSINHLAETAGNDGVLNSEEYFGVNITPLTTAQYAEIENQLTELDSNENRKNAFLAMHPIRSLEKAAFISRMFSDIDFNLPQPAQTTLDFLLDENLSETYLEAFRTIGFYWVHSLITAIQSDSSQSVVSPGKLIGTYFLESLSHTYMLSFNEDGTGHLEAASIDTRFYVTDSVINTEFTWIRKAKQIRIQFPQPIVYHTNYYISENQYIPCRIYSEANEECSVSFSEIDLDLITDTESGRLAYIRQSAQFVSEFDYEEIDLSRELARLVSVNDLHSVVRSDIQDYEWYTRKNRYVFSENGTVSKTDLLTKAEENLEWELTTNHLMVGSETLWITNKNIAGYDVISVNESNVIRQPMIKRYPVNMDEDEWIGRWQSYPFDMFSTTHDVNADKTWRDGFETETAGSWSVGNDHVQTAISNGTWRMDRDVLAVHANKYYMSICQGPGKATANFIPSECYLSVVTKAANFDSNAFWAHWSNPAFNEKVSGGAWVPVWGNVHHTDESGEIVVTPYVRISSNKLFNTYEETILEMTSAGKNEMELCAYRMFEICDESEKRVYERGIELELVTTGEGSIRLRLQGNGAGGTFYTSERTLSKVVMVTKGYPQELIIKNESGEILDPGAVTGCDGILDEDVYLIPARTEGCQVTVNFED